MGNLNQTFMTALPFYALIILYLVTFIFWMYLQKTLNKFSRWAILSVIMYIGSSTTNNFYSGYNLLDTNFLVNLSICFLLILVMRGYMFHISEGYSTQTKTLGEVFNGEACRTTFKDKKQFAKPNERPVIFFINFIVIVAICMVGTRTFWWVNREISQEKVVKVLNENTEIKKENSKSKKEIKESKKTNEVLLQKMIEDSVTLEIKTDEKNE